MIGYNFFSGLSNNSKVNIWCWVYVLGFVVLGLLQSLSVMFWWFMYPFATVLYMARCDDESVDNLKERIDEQ